MISVSKAFKRKLYSDDYSFINSANITLANGIVLDEITNTSIMSSGLSIEDAVGSDEAFDALGSTVINSATLTLYNKDEIYSNYDFDNAKVVLYTALEVDTVISGEPTTVVEKIKKGTFTVDNATFGDSTITLTMLDNMEQFDRPYSLSNLSYPATLGAIVRDACSICDVTLATNSLQFPHYDFTVQNRPDEDSTTFREVLGWCATIAGCFASCNPDGQLELKWYDTSALENSDGTDGGIFDNANVNWLLNYMNTELGMAVVSSSSADDTWYRIDNTFDFEFNGTVSDYIYIDSDSCYAFANTQPSNHGHRSGKDVNILTRDGQSISIKYQELSVDNNNAIKVRFHGYTNYNSSAQTREYELEYEIFFINSGIVVVNFITLPTNTSYLGTSNIIENSTSYTITPTTDNIVAMYRQLNGGWGTNSSNLPYLTGDKVYGGIFNPWDNGDDVDGNTFTENIVPHYITSLYNQNIGVDDVIITGVKITVKVEDTTAEQDTIEYLTGTEDYLVEISENPFITKDNANTILGWLSTQLVGLRFRKCNITHVGDPTIEAGDVGLVWDTLGEEHPILISRVTFSPGSSQTIVCGAKTVSNNNSTRFSTQTKNFVSTRKQLRQQREEYQAAMEDLAEAIENANGLYETDVVQQDQSVIRYLHNKPELSESDIQIVISDVGITMTPDGGQHWYGMTVDGTLISSILNTIGINADWINSGTVSANYIRGGKYLVGGVGNDYGVIEIRDRDDKVIGELNRYGIRVLNDYSSDAFTTALGSPDVWDGWDIDKDIKYTNIPPRSTSQDKTMPVSDGLYVSAKDKNENRYAKICVVINRQSNNPYVAMNSYSSNSPSSSPDPIISGYVFDFIKTAQLSSTLVEHKIKLNEAFIYNLYTINSNQVITAQLYKYQDRARFRISTFYRSDGTTTGDTLLDFYYGHTPAYNSSSSKRFKHNIKLLKNKILDPHKLLKLPIKEFVYNDNHPLQYDDMKGQLLPGFIAEDVAEIYPSAVIHDDNGNIESWDERRIIPGMLSLIQEQHKKIKKLETRLDKLEKLLSRLNII